MKKCKTIALCNQKGGVTKAAQAFEEFTKEVVHDVIQEVVYWSYDIEDIPAVLERGRLVAESEQ